MQPHRILLRMQLEAPDIVIIFDSVGSLRRATALQLSSIDMNNAYLRRIVWP